MSRYPSFTVPSEHAAKPVADWSAGEAARYLTWLTTAIDKRVTGLLAFLGVSEDEDRSLLQQVGDRASWVLRKPEFSKLGEPRGLTESGYALAADLGLLVAQRLCRRLPHLRWEVVRRPRRDASYNQPVLKGFGAMHFDPVRGSVAEALRVARGEAEGNAWLRIFDHWEARGLSMRGVAAGDLPNP